LPSFQRDDELGAPGRCANDASIESAMPQCATAVPQVERGRPAARIHTSPAAGGQAGALGEIDQRAGHHEKRQANTDRRQHRMPPSSAKAAATGDPIRRRNATSGAAPRQQIAALPGKQRSERHGHIRARTAAERQIEERFRRPRFLRRVKDSSASGYKRPDENGQASGGEKQIIEHQRAFARDRRETARPASTTAHAR